MGVEPAGKGLNTTEHAASMAKGSVGVIHGFKCYILQDEQGGTATCLFHCCWSDYQCRA